MTKTREAQTAPSLEVRDVSLAFDGVIALEDVDLRVSADEVLGLIGPNGAGKSTLINVITGFQSCDRGTVLLGGVDITGASPQRRARLGLGRTFQSVRTFKGLSVLDNVEAAALCHDRSRARARARAKELLQATGLASRAHQAAHAIPYGDERRLAIARALALSPKLLLLDEPAAGLDDAETDELGAFISTLPARYGCGVLVVEHDIGLIMGICHRIHVLAFGRTVGAGTPGEIRRDPAVAEAYLGHAGGAAA